MMFQTLSLLALVASADAFAPAGFGARASTLLKADSAEAIKEAMAASEKFGASSPEARSAWDVVEEIDASTRYVADVEKRIASIDFVGIPDFFLLIQYFVGTTSPMTFTPKRLRLSKLKKPLRHPTDSQQKLKNGPRSAMKLLLKPSD